MAATINISTLPKDGVYYPFYFAAGLDVWERPEELSETEALIYQLHQVKPETDIRRKAEVEDFLKAIEPDQAQMIQNKARNMFGVARLLTEGSTMELVRDGKTAPHKIFSEKYQRIYAENPNLTPQELASKTEWGEREAIFKDRMSGVSSEILDGQVGLVGTAIISGFAGGAVAFMGFILGAPVLLPSVMVGGVVVVGMTAAKVGKEALGVVSDYATGLGRRLKNIFA